MSTPSYRQALGRKIAEEISPELVHGHELVRRLVSDLLTMQDPPSAELRELAGRG